MIDILRTASEAAGRRSARRRPPQDSGRCRCDPGPAPGGVRASAAGVDVAAVASALGGGGHVRAAGFGFVGTPAEAIAVLPSRLDRASTGSLDRRYDRPSELHTVLRPSCLPPRLRRPTTDRYIMDTSAQPSAADRVYQHVRTGILNSRFADNDLLAEGRIAQETGVSRTPVREALLRLEAEGMVAPTAQTRRSGAAGQRPGVARRAGHSRAGRNPLRPRGHREWAGRPAGRSAGASGRRPPPAARSGDLAAYVSADRDFHATIVAAAGNSILNRLYGSLRDRQMRMGAAEPAGR